MPQLGPEYALAVRLRALEDLVAKLASNQLGQAFSSTQSDGSIGLSVMQSTAGAGATVTRWYAGPNTPRDANTGQHQAMLYIGELLNPDGSKTGDSGLVFFYAAGGAMLALDRQSVGLYDSGVNLIFGNDVTSGEGLARPWVPLQAPVPTGTGQWASTTATTWGEMARSYANVQHRTIQWSADGYCPTGTGSVQLVVKDFSSNVLASGAVHTFSSGFGSWSDVLTLPAGHYGQEVFISVMGEVTSGTGSVACQTWELYGRQS